MTGIYYSHPTAAPFPAENDVMNAHYPEVAYFIISFAFGKAKIKCYRAIKQRVSQLNIKVIE